MIKRIKLQNWKSHAETEINFTEGTNVLVGPMGAGKSSVLQAICFALFGTFNELKRKDLKISDLVKRNAQTKIAQVDLELSTQNSVLEIKRIVEEGSTKEAAVRNKEGKLLAGTNPAQVNMFLKDVLKLDEDVFLRTIYAKQNEIDLFLQLTPLERKTRLDELMGLDKFEEARKNCVKLANQISLKKDIQEEFVKDFKIENLAKEIESLEKDSEDIDTEKNNIRLQVQDMSNKKLELNTKIKQLRTSLDDYTKLNERAQLLSQQLKELEEKLVSVELDEDLQSVNFRLREIKSTLSELQRGKSNLKEDLERNQKNALELEKKLGALEQKSAELIEALAEIEKLKAYLQELEQIGNLAFLEGRVQTAKEVIIRTSDERSQILGEVNVLKKHLLELETAEGACPVCSAELEQTKKNELISQRRQKIAELQARVDELAINAENLKKEQAKIEEVHEKQRDITKRIEQMENLLREEREIAIQLSQVKGKKETLAEIIAQMQQRFDNFEVEIISLDAEYTKLAEKRHLCELKEKENEIRKEVERISSELVSKTVSPDELAILQEQYETIIRTVQESESRLSSLDYILEEKQKRLADYNEKKNKYSEVKEQIKVLQDKVDFLSQFKNALLSAQESLRKELILAVNEVMASLWTQLYPYEKWTSIKLDASEEDYVLRLRERESDWISVAGFASGGERMLACLALRLAFAKVLAQNFNILILDEPTHNLDDRAINTLVEVIQNRLSGFLDQLFIVTHDEKLAEAGDNIIRL